MLHLHIIRHAKTNKQVTSGRDFDRLLLPRGIAQCSSLNAHLSARGTHIQQALVSSAKRTQQTYDGIKSGIQIDHVKHTEALYLASQEEYLNHLWKLADEKHVMIIGHNFGLSDLVTYFTDSDMILATSEYVEITFEAAHWNETSRGLGTLVHQYRPKD